MLGNLQRIQIHYVQVLTFEDVITLETFSGGTWAVRALLGADCVCFFDQIVGHLDELLTDLTVNAFDKEAYLIVRVVCTAGLLFLRPAPGKLGAMSNLPVLTLHPEVVVRTFLAHVGAFTAFYLLFTGWTIGLANRLFTTSLFRSWRTLTSLSKGRSRSGLRTLALILIAVEYRTATTRHVTTSEHTVAGPFVLRLVTVEPGTAIAVLITPVKHATAATTTAPLTRLTAATTLSVTAATAGVARQTVQNVVPFGVCTLHIAVDVIRYGVRELPIGQAEGATVCINARHDDVTDGGFIFPLTTGPTQFVFSNHSDHFDDVGHLVVVPVAFGHVIRVSTTQVVVPGAVFDIVHGFVVDKIDEIAHDNSSWLNSLNKTLYTV
ncbi:hypothetical protein D3C76_765740 [compost metagenome]